jgi:hypothetical protein
MIRDEVQYVKKHKYPDGRTDKSFQADTPIKQSFGVYLLSVPTKHIGFSPLIETPVSYDLPWREDHQKTLRIAYSHSPNFSSIHKEISRLLTSKYENLAQLNITTIIWGSLRLLGYENIPKDDLNLESINKVLKRQKIFRLKEIRRSSQSKVAKDLGDMSANEKIIALCKEVGANEDYCGGTAAAAYMDNKAYEENGIKTTIQDWKCKEYPQLFTRQVGFIPNLSIIDLLMNVTAEKARDVILSDD